MRLLCIGDVCGDAGCEYLKRLLPKIKKDYNVDAVIVNGENSADGNGITPQSADFLGSFLLLPWGFQRENCPCVPG